MIPAKQTAPERTRLLRTNSQIRQVRALSTTPFYGVLRTRSGCALAGAIHGESGTGRLRRTPLAGRYPAGVLMALLVLCPFIVLSTATAPLDTVLRADLDASTYGLQLASGLADAGYAFDASCASLSPE
jgi:hypothetical protein